MSCVISLPVSPTLVLVPKCADCGHCWVYSFYVLLLIFPNLTFAPKWCAYCVHCVVSFVVLLPLFNYLFLCQKVLITAATLNIVRLQYFFFYYGFEPISEACVNALVNAMLFFIVSNEFINLFVRKIVQ